MYILTANSQTGKDIHKNYDYYNVDFYMNCENTTGYMLMILNEKKASRSKIMLMDGLGHYFLTNDPHLGKMLLLHNIHADINKSECFLTS